MLNQRLSRHAQHHPPIRVALAGAGSMGKGIAYQLGITPGMQLIAVIDKDPASVTLACDHYAEAMTLAGSEVNHIDRLTSPPQSIPELDALDYDVLVEATNSVGFAADLCESAIVGNHHVVLMNAEVDLAVGDRLRRLAGAHQVVCTSDAGDQHGVLMRMMDEIQVWGFEIVMAGNIKGFLNRYATAATLGEEARKRRLNPIQCCAYTDGTKLSIEMALVANAMGLVSTELGMAGPKADHVEQVMDLFDFHKLPRTGVVDYILGARPGGGVFVVGRCDSGLQQPYLHYYKMGDGPFYLFYRPYHLCHLETPRAIASAALDGNSLLDFAGPRTVDVFAFAKKDLVKGDAIEIAIGGDCCFGMIDACHGDKRIPITLLDRESGSPEVARLRHSIPKDAPLTWDDVDVPDSTLLNRYRQERANARG